MARDTQRERLYRAERTVPEFDDIHGDGSMATTKAWIDGVITSSWWRNRGGIRCVSIGDGRRRSNAVGGYGYVKLPRWARSRMVMLHELAHVLTFNNDSYVDLAGHGPEFAANYLALVRRFAPDKADALLAGFKLHRVRHRGGAKAKRRPAPRAQCWGCRKDAIVATMWRLPSVHARFCTKRCATAWLARELKRAA